MSTIIDGFSLLRAVGQHPDLFSNLAADIKKAALAMSKKFLKGKDIGLDELKSFNQAVGTETFALILEDLNEKELRTLTKKIDKHYPSLADEKPTGLRSHLRALALSRADLSPKPAPAPRKAQSSSGAKPKKKTAERSDANAAWPRSMSARPSRR